MIENQFINSNNIAWIYKCINKENISAFNWGEKAIFSGANIRHRLMKGFVCQDPDPWLAANIAVASLNPDDKADLYVTVLKSLVSSVGSKNISTISSLIKDALHLLQGEEQVPILEHASNEILSFCIDTIGRLSVGSEGISKFRLADICQSLLELGYLNPSFYSYLKDPLTTQLAGYQKIDGMKALELKTLNECGLSIDLPHPEDIHRIDRDLKFQWLANPFCDQKILDDFFRAVTDEHQSGTGGNVALASNFLIHNPNLKKEQVEKILKSNNLTRSYSRNMVWPMSPFYGLSESEVFEYASIDNTVLSIKAAPLQYRASALARLLQESLDKEDYEKTADLIRKCSGTPLLGMLSPQMRFNLLKMTYAPGSQHVSLLLDDLNVDALCIIDLATSGLTPSSIAKEFGVTNEELNDLMSIIFTECAMGISNNEPSLSEYGLVQFLESGLVHLNASFKGGDSISEQSISDFLLSSKINPELMESLVSASLSISTQAVGSAIKTQKRGRSL